MLTSEQIQESKLKRSNISVSSEKTKLRFAEIFKPAKIKDKQAVRELAGVTSQVAHNIYNTGNISIKMVIAVSQTLNVNPFYLTGEADEPGEFSDEALRKLLMQHGYRDLIAKLELKRPYNRREKPADEEAAAAPVEAEAEPEAAELLAAPAPAVSLEESEQFALLVAIRVRAKAGIDGAQARLDEINRLLLG